MSTKDPRPQKPPSATHAAREGAIPAARDGGTATTPPSTTAAPAAARTAGTVAARRLLAVLRLATGVVFLWAFLDKLFGLGYSTQSENSWINGGSPTEGYLGGVEVGPFESMFTAMSGHWLVDWLFMLGLLGVGIALIFGIAMWIAAIAGSVMMLGMWAAEWPLAQNTSAGEATMSSNPLVEYHIIYALALLVLAATYAGVTWGMGASWADLRFVRRHRWLR